MQEVDAERRIQILRGLQPAPPPTVIIEDNEGGSKRGSQGGQGRERKRRKLAGEDDTDFAIRLAKEEQLQRSSAREGASETQAAKKKVGNDAPITDHAGHINLFPAPLSRHHVQKNPEAEAEAAKKKREFEDQYTMRFSNAAGFKQDIGAKPWYSSLGGQTTGGESADVVEGPVGKDVWGNKDPRRKEREKIRIDASDPLMAIRQGVEGLRKVERERKKWMEERDREARELKELGERERRRKKRRKYRDEDELEGFSLDAQARDRAGEDRMEKEEGHRPRRHRHRDRSTSSGSTHHNSREYDRKGSRKDGQEDGRHRYGKHGTHRHSSERYPSHHGRDGRESQERRKPNPLLDKIKADGGPGWTPGFGGRYSSQFASA